MFVEVAWSGAWLGMEEGALYIAGARGDASPPELSGHVANGDEKLQSEGANTQRQRRSLPTLMDEHRRRWRKWTSARAHCGILATTRPCLLRRLRRRRVPGSGEE